MVVPAVLGGGVPALTNLFVLPLMAEYEASRATVILLIELGMVSGLVVGPFVGRLLLRIAPWQVMLIGMVGGVFALLAASFFETLAASMTGFGLAHMFGAAFSGVLSAQTFIVRRNPERLGIVSGGQTVMSAVFGAVLSLSIPPIMESHGWRVASAVYAGLAAALMLALIIGLMRGSGPTSDAAPAVSPDAVTEAQKVPGTMDILRAGHFWLLMAAIIPLSIAALSISINVIPFFADRGVGTQQASFVLAGIGMGAALGALGVGAIVERIHPALVMSGIAALATAGLAAIAADIGNPAWFLIAIFVGLSGVAPILAVGVKRLFGAAAYPPVFGLAGPFLLLSAFSGAGTGWLRDHLGSYLPVFGIIAGLCAVSLAASLLLMRRELVED